MWPLCQLSRGMAEHITCLIKRQGMMESQPDEDGYDKWNTFSAVFDTGWNG